MTTRSRFLASSATVGVLGLVPSWVRAAEARKLTIGYVPSTLFAPVFVAAERGYYRDAGLEPNLVPIVAGQDAMALLAAGQLDFIAAGISAAFYNAVNRGLDVRLVASTGYQPRKGRPSALMMREDLYAAGAHDASSLRGKKIGWIGGAGATSSYYVARILRPFGLTMRDIEAVNISNPDQAIALERKAVDAVFSSSPFTETFAERKLAHFIANPPPSISGTGLFFGPTVLKNHEVAQAIMTASRRGAADVVGNGYYRRENLEAFAKYTKQPLETLQRAARYDFLSDLRIDQPTVEDMQREFALQGVLSYKNLLNEVRLVARF